MNRLYTIALALVVSAGLALAQAPNSNAGQNPNQSSNQSSSSQANQNSQSSNSSANPSGAAANSGTPNAQPARRMPATASPLGLLVLMGIGATGAGAMLRKHRFNN